MPTSSRTYTLSPIERWAKFYRNPNPFETGNYPVFEREEVLWNAMAINEMLSRAIPGVHNWYVTPGALNVSLAIGRNRHGTHEIACKQTSTNKDSYVWAIVTEVRQQPQAIKDAKGPAYDDKVTGALIKDALKTHGRENCPKCTSYNLKQVRTALFCERCKTMVGGF